MLKAIRDNEPRAISLGYDINRYKLLAFVLSAALTFAALVVIEAYRNSIPHEGVPGDEAWWATDDGSLGVTGSVLQAVPAGVGQVLGCGPNRMLAALAERWPEAQVALETYMGCGTGVCLGCAVPRTSGVFDRACQEGPVYRAGSIRWRELPAALHYAVSA